MKKTFPVNINGKIFYIDEDAYTLLQSYLSQLRATFPGQEGSEIVSDIECRISELFDERICAGANVIVLEDVNNVIETMGRPEQISDESEFCASETHANGSEPNGGRPAGCPPPPPVHKKLYRDVRHKVFGGVIAGLAQYTGWDVTVMRILIVALAVLPIPILSINFGTWVLIYLIAWMVIPVARTPRQILEMQGQPVTLDNVGQTVINNSVPPVAPVPNENASTFSNFLNTLFSVVAKCVLAFVGFAAGITAIGLFVCALCILVGLGAYYFISDPEILEFLDFSLTNPYIDGWGAVCVMMAILIPAVAIWWAACTVIFKVKGASAPVLITGVVFEIIFFVAAAILLNISPESNDIALATFSSLAPASILPPMLS